MFQFSSAPPLTLYVHIPWCVRKCPYCDFNSHDQKTELPQLEYVDALLRDLEQDLPRVNGRALASIFIGGGTPSLFAAGAIERLLAGVRARTGLTGDVEITMEANPGTMEQGRFDEFRAAGINRLSIGVQSFKDELLGRLGRIHSGREAVRAAESSHAAGFDNFNLDLMFGLPNQSPNDALDDLRNAVDLEPTHISWYQLTIEPNTLFYRRPPALPEEENIWMMQQQGQDLLTRRGYAQYEVSAYARPERRCRHNLNYWQFGDYLGIGAGAHAKITNMAAQAITRIWKPRHPREYLDHAGTPKGIGGETRLGEQDAVLEFMMNALRLTGGVPEPLFAQRTGLSLADIRRPLRLAEDRKLLTRADGILRPTALGQRFLNDLLGLFAEPGAQG